MVASKYTDVKPNSSKQAPHEMRSSLAIQAGSSCSSSRAQQRPGTCRHDTRPLFRTRQLTAHALPHNQDQQQLFPQSQALLAATVTAVSLLISSPAQAATAEANFGTKCVGCHVNGGNIIQANATLFQVDLEKYGFADSDSLYKIIYSGKGRMPGFGQECAPRAQCTFGPKLTDEEVQGLVQYVQDQAAAGWKQ